MSLAKCLPEECGMFQQNLFRIEARARRPTAQGEESIAPAARDSGMNQPQEMDRQL
jgi:hypothetical protein